MPGRILSLEELKRTVEELKNEGKTIVFTNGCFDLLHVGHVRYLSGAKKLGDVLVVAVNSDSSVRDLKGPKRPVNGENDRAEVIAALSSVDFVTIFSEKTANLVLESLKPHIYVKGGDYRVEDLPEAETVRSYGGQIILLPMVEGSSSSNMIDKIIDAYGAEV